MPARLPNHSKHVSPFIWFGLLVLFSSIVLGMIVTTSQPQDPRAGAVYTLPPGNGLNPIVIPSIQIPTPTIDKRIFPACCLERMNTKKYPKGGPVAVDFCKSWTDKLHLDSCECVPFPGESNPCK